MLASNSCPQKYSKLDSCTHWKANAENNIVNCCTSVIQKWDISNLRAISVTRTSSILKEGYFRVTFKVELGKLVRSVHLNRVSLIQADQVGSPDFGYLTYFFILRDQKYFGT